MTKQRMEIAKAVGVRAMQDEADMADMMNGTPLDVWITSRNGNFKRIADVVLTDEEKQVASNYIEELKAYEALP